MSLWRNIVNYVCGNPTPEEKDVVIHDFTKRSREKDLLLTKVTTLLWILTKTLRVLNLTIKPLLLQGVLISLQACTV